MPQVRPTDPTAQSRRVQWWRFALPIIATLLLLALVVEAWRGVRNRTPTAKIQITQTDSDGARITRAVISGTDSQAARYRFEASQATSNTNNLAQTDTAQLIAPRGTLITAEVIYTLKAEQGVLSANGTQIRFSQNTQITIAPNALPANDGATQATRIAMEDLRYDFASGFLHAQNKVIATRNDATIRADNLTIDSAHGTLTLSGAVTMTRPPQSPRLSPPPPPTAKQRIRFATDPTAPLILTAAQARLTTRDNTIRLIDKAQITQGAFQLAADTITLIYGENKHPIEARAQGRVALKSGATHGKGKHARYDFATQIMTVAGGVMVAQGATKLQGDALRLDMASGYASVKRASARIIPKEQK